VTSAPASETFPVFGTTAVLLVTRPAAISRARAIAGPALAAVDAACSRFRPDSELSILNGLRAELFRTSELFAQLIAEALRAAELTDGAVDPTCGAALLAAGYDRDFGEIARQARPAKAGGAPVPGWRTVEFDQAARTVRLAAGTRLDLGATAKAWAADYCAALIAAELGCGTLVSLGGDIAVAGPGPAGGWQVKVTDDHAAGHGAPGQVISISEGGLATSSTTVRTWTAGGQAMHHIIDPATGAPARSAWRTVSVAAASCADANIASTAAIIRSDAAPSWLTSAGLPARLVASDGSVTTTPGWPALP
jgi:thiamine biosynthesis lipoprotein